MASLTKAQQLRTVIISLDDLENVQDALDKLANNQALTAGESGLVEVAPISNATLVGAPAVVFDGEKWNVFLWLTTS